MTSGLATKIQESPEVASTMWRASVTLGPGVQVRPSRSTVGNSYRGRIFPWL
jgi:dUTPase